jgi:hypothetical protein
MVAPASAPLERVRGGSPWLFGMAVDLAIFAGPILLTLLFAMLATADAGPHVETPEWAWILFVLMVDVAHVWGTGLRVYADTSELRRRPLLYGGVPILAYLGSTAAFWAGPSIFWRLLAYVAVFHFVRQQMGWMRLYRHRAGDQSALGNACDTCAIAVATGCPLLYWHTHLPRHFDWMLQGDFVALPSISPALLWGTYATGLGLYAARSLAGWAQGRGAPGPDLVVAGTAITWFVGIVATDSDFVFTVSNVLLHGVPYFALIYFYGRGRLRSAAPSGPWALFRGGPTAMLAILWGLALLEEILWDWGVWHEQPSLFGAGPGLRIAHVFIVPLLAVPQLTHYILDAVIWRRAKNPTLASLF